MMKRYLQTDPRWGNSFLGNTNLTFKRWGCTTTCIAMACTYFRQNEDPLSVSRKIQYDKNGLILWGSLFLPFRLAYTRIKFPDYRRIDTALKNPDEVALIEVNLGRGSHWVVATAKIPFTNHYIVADPLRPGLVTTMRYGGVVGACILTIAR